jgi:hypothetical protein
MLGKQRRVGYHDVRELAFQRLGDAGVQLLAPTAQQSAVSSVLNQSVLEGVFGVGRCPVPEDQFGAH